jgi:hypothetical protein
VDLFRDSAPPRRIRVGLKGGMGLIVVVVVVGWRTFWEWFGLRSVLLEDYFLWGFGYWVLVLVFGSFIRRSLGLNAGKDLGDIWVGRC